eukprot:1360932-Prymnesium_polylepis.1
MRVGSCSWSTCNTSGTQSMDDAVHSWIMQTRNICRRSAGWRPWAWMVVGAKVRTGGFVRLVVEVVAGVSNRSRRAPGAVLETAVLARVCPRRGPFPIRTAAGPQSARVCATASHDPMCRSVRFALYDSTHSIP